MKNGGKNKSVAFIILFSIHYFCFLKAVALTKKHNGRTIRVMVSCVNTIVLWYMPLYWMIAIFSTIVFHTTGFSTKTVRIEYWDRIQPARALFTCQVKTHGENCIKMKRWKCHLSWVSRTTASVSSCCLRFPACHTWAPSHKVSLTQTVGCYTWLSSLTTRAGCCGIKHIITSLGTIRVSLQLGAAASFIPTTVWISTIQACEFRSYLKIYISDSVASVSTRITFYRVVRQVDKKRKKNVFVTSIGFKDIVCKFCCDRAHKVSPVVAKSITGQKGFVLVLSRLRRCSLAWALVWISMSCGY